MTDEPAFATDFVALATIAADLHAQRALHYPTHVAKRTLTLAEADAGIRIMGAIAADWRRALDRKPLPDNVPIASRSERVHTLEIAAQRQRIRIARAREEMEEAYRNAPAAPLPDAIVAELRSLVATGMKPAAPVERYCVQVEYGECIDALLWWEQRRIPIAWLTDFNIAARLRYPMQPASKAA